MPYRTARKLYNEELNVYISSAWDEFNEAAEPRRSNPTKSEKQPLARDLNDAVQTWNEGFDEHRDLRDFDLKYLGLLSVGDLEQYDDLGSWCDYSEGEFDGVPLEDRLQELESFRGVGWAGRAREWIRGGIPPIIVVSGPEGTMIGDGRGRVNFATMMGVKLPTWELALKE